LNKIIGGNGGDWIYFTKNRRLIGDFIRSNQIKPVTIAPVSSRAGAPARALLDLGIRGGIRVPHLHFNNKIYLLDNKQWSQFSKGIIADSKARLANVKEVGFEEGMLLGSVAQTFGKG
jgi:hypothetical protein